MTPANSETYDAVVIGGGVIGCAVLRELSRYRLKILLVERNADLAEGVSKANSGVIHAGFNVPNGTLKAKMNIEGLSRIYGMAEELSVPIKQTGKLVVSLDDAGKERLVVLKRQGDTNGTPGLEIIDSSRMKAIEPLAAGKWALWSPKTGIISPYQFTVALAECAWQNGAHLLFETPVTGVTENADYFVLSTPKLRISTRWVINCAGLFSDAIARMAGIENYMIYPYRGEYLITDKADELNLRMPIYPVPPEDGPGLGVHITPTMDNNILLGPSARYIEDRTNTATTRQILDQLKEDAYSLMPELRGLPFIHSFSGVRPKLVNPNGNEMFRDFIIEESERCPQWINLIGIESPGLTSSPAIASHVIEMMGIKEDLKPKSEFIPERPGIPRFAELDDEVRRRLVAENPDWGEMVCRCESVTRAEVEMALSNPFRIMTLDSIKRRSRCGMGRCQGGFCTPRIIDIWHQKGYSHSEMTKRGKHSNLFFGKIKD